MKVQTLLVTFQEGTNLADLGFRSLGKEFNYSVVVDGALVSGDEFGYV
jgi:hypothetical protein